jgi:deoxyribodipyrimidine photo-lyase
MLTLPSLIVEGRLKNMSRPLSLNAPVLEIIERDFQGLYSGELGLSSIQGGQSAANQALVELDIAGYANCRSEVLPKSKRGATVLSPYIRHNILTLDQVYRAVKGAPFRDRDKFRDELYWQEYARHLYARIGTRLFENLRFDANATAQGDGWNRDMACVDEMVSELQTDGWLVNQTRMWLASHWTVRNDVGWLHGQEAMYRELIDGSRAANLLGWQWTVGAGTGKPYGFARWQVEKRAPGLCRQCPLAKACPIQEFPQESSLDRLEVDSLLEFDPNPDMTAGPRLATKIRPPQSVLLTIDSLGDNDPALVANPDLPAVFVFNEEALKKLQLSSRRIGFYLETLQDLSERRNVQALVGDPYQYAQEHDVAVTFAPVPSFRKFKSLAEIHPFPWLMQPHTGSVKSFSSWRKFK